MIHLIYKSSECQAFGSADLKRLLLRSRIRNRDVGVTGILVYLAGTFLQAIEGDAAAVDATLARIESDPRHGDLCILNRGVSLSRQRIFGDWSMGFADAAGVARVLHGFIGLEDDPGPPAFDAAQAFDFLLACSRAPVERPA